MTSYRWLMVTVLSLIAYQLSLITSTAQTERFLRYDCMGGGTAEMMQTDGQAANRMPRRKLSLMTQWDSTRVYPVAVVLVSFADKNFSAEDPLDLYQRMFNEEGYNQGRGAGCIADYYRSQSDGWFNPRFDIYGPIKVEGKCTEYDTYGSDAFYSATRLLVDSIGVDFSLYDWNDDRMAEHIIFIYAGYGGNEDVNKDKGYIWPNTSSFSAINADGIRVALYSASAELWSNDRSCGIGTICHEFAHTLGLPDLYPTNGSEYSVVDEWDLMDGGNFINNGWCPPNFSAHEKMLLGWLTPQELTEATFVEGLLPVSEGGVAYIIRTNNANEFFLLENRQWKGWDLRTPGHGLIITHVDYSASSWSGNYVNNEPNHHRYDLIHADNMGYNQWDKLIGDGSVHVGGHSRILSGTPFPYITDSIENRSFTDTSVPAAVTFSKPGLLGKPITNIEENEETVSFHFMDIDSGISALRHSDKQSSDSPVYDLTGRRTTPTHRGLYISNGKLIIKQ